MRGKTTIVTLLSLVALTIQAGAQQYLPGSPLGTASNFNAFIFGNADAPSGHADGAIAVGGNWTNMGYTVTEHGYPGTVGSTSNIGMYIAGNLSLVSNATADSSTDVRVKGTLSLNGNTLTLNGGTLYNNSGAVDSTAFTSQKTYSTYQSSHLKALTGAAINTSTSSWTIDANASTQYGTLKIFTVAGSALGPQNAPTLNFTNFTSSDTIVINVSGDVSSYNINNNGPLGNGDFSQLLWNFTTGTSNTPGTVTIDHNIRGSVLAPNAVIHQSANIDGLLVGQQLYVTNAAELHEASTSNFKGDLSRVSPNSGSSTPEPGAMTLLCGLGLAAAAFGRRRACRR